MPGATPTYALPYPIATDRLDDAVTTIPQSLALAVESTMTAWGGIAAPTAWTAPAYAAGVTSLGGAFQPSRYRKAGSLVRCRGLVSTSVAKAAGAVMCTLPVGFRPLATERFVVVSSAGAGATICDVDSAGQVITQAALAIGGYMSLCGIAFYTD